MVLVNPNSKDGKANQHHKCKRYYNKKSVEVKVNIQKTRPAQVAV